MRILTSKILRVINGFIFIANLQLLFDLDQKPAIKTKPSTPKNDGLYVWGSKLNETTFKSP